MQQLIASFLFQNRSCPLPGLGTLSLTETEAVADFSNKTITPPLSEIHFEPGETNRDDLLAYMARSTNTPVNEANAALDHFCAELKNDISTKATANLDGIGNFYVDGNGKMKFSQSPLPQYFLDPVSAERVIHPNAEHLILVGDKESTNTLMTEYFSEESPVKDRWWIWALLLGGIGLIILLFYFNDMDRGSLFGNAVKL